MVTGASTADLSVILIDARKGVLTQTRRHSFLVSLLGIRHVVLVVNKMDLVDYSREVFAGIEDDYRKFAAELGLPTVTCIPVSAVKGDNILQRSAATPWYEGPTLMGLLDSVEVDESRLREQPLRLPVQWVNRPNADFRGFAGTIVGGPAAQGRPDSRPALRPHEPRGAHRDLRRRSRRGQSSGSPSPSRSRTRSTSRAAI